VSGAVADGVGPVGGRWLGLRIESDSFLVKQEDVDCCFL